MNLLEVNNICKTYGSGETAVKALKNVSFSVPKGEYVAIVGESGSGKSTLLNIIGALDAPTSGRVMIDGKEIFSMNDRKLTVFRRRNIGFIFQAFNLVPELTVEQNIIFPMLLDYQKPDREYLEELLTGAKKSSAKPAVRRSTTESSDWTGAYYQTITDTCRRTHRKFGYTKQQ